jgi:hypothetical protein
MTECHELFSDGAAYERMMGRWSRVAGKSFLDWIELPSGLRCSTSASAMVLSPKS